MASNSFSNSRTAFLTVLMVSYVSFTCLTENGTLAAAQAQAIVPENNAVDHAAVAEATNAYAYEQAAPEPARAAVKQQQDASSDVAATNSYEGATVDQSSAQLPQQDAGQEGGRVVNAAQPQIERVAHIETRATASAGLAAPQQQAAGSEIKPQPAVDSNVAGSNMYKAKSVTQLEADNQTKQTTQDAGQKPSQQQQQQTHPQHEDAATLPQQSTAATMGTGPNIQAVSHTETSLQDPAQQQQQHAGGNAQVADSPALVIAGAAASNAFEGSLRHYPQNLGQTKSAVQEGVRQLAVIQQQPVVDSAAARSPGTIDRIKHAGSANSYEGEEIVEVSHGDAVKQHRQQESGATSTTQQQPEEANPTLTTATVTAGQTAQQQSSLLPTAGAQAPDATGTAEDGAPQNPYEGETVLDPGAAPGVLAASADAPKAAASVQQPQQQQHQEQQEATTGGHASPTATASTTAEVESQQPEDPDADTESVSNPPHGSDTRPNEEQLAALAEDQKPQIPARELQATTATMAAHKVSASTTYQADLAELKALASLFKPVYSVDDPTTHATPESGQQKPPTPPASGRSTKAAGTSIDDMTLGLGQNYPVPSSTKQQQQQRCAHAGNPVNPQAAKGSGYVSGGPNTPGFFVGGPTWTQQHAGWKSDNPEHQDATEDGAGTYVAAGGVASVVNKNIFNSLNTDLAFLISSKQSSRRFERRLMSLDGQAGGGAGGADSTDTGSAAVDGPSNAVPGPLQYPAGTFDLSAAAVQAAQMQIEELQQLLAAKRVSKVQLEQAPVPDFESATFTISGGKQPATAAGQVPSKLNHRKLIDTSAASAKVQELTKSGRADKPLWGVTYSWRRTEACDGARQMCRCPRPEELDTDLNLLYRYSHRIRTYSVECPELMRMLLHYTTANPSASWLIGVWIGADPAANLAQIKLLGHLLEEFPLASLSGIAVGNEAVGRGDVKEPELIEYIEQVRNMVRGIAQKTDIQSLAQVPIMTVEQPAAFTPQLAAAIDAAGAVIQPFFSGAVDTAQSSWVKSATGVALQQYTQLQEEMKGKQVLIAEIGWPSRSGEVDTNRASLAHAAEFATAWVKAADKLSIPYYYHELADAGWKAALRQSAASAAAAARTLKGRHQQPSILGQGVLGDEHFGLVTADRMTDKGLLPQHKA